MPDTTITVTVPIERLPGLSALLLDYLDSPDQMTVVAVDDSRRPARSADWQNATREFFKVRPGELFSTSDIVDEITSHGVRIDRATVSRYLSHLVAQGYLKPEGAGRYREYQINPLGMSESGV